MKLPYRPYTIIFAVVVFVNLCALTVPRGELADAFIIAGLMVYIFVARKSRV